jgi:signal peptide peptidase SppA
VNLYNEVLRGAFFIEPFHGMSFAMQLHGHFHEGKPLNLVRNASEEKNASEPQAINYTFTPHTIDEDGQQISFNSTNAFSKKGSVAIIPVRDALTKYDYCGSPGTMTLEAQINKAVAAKNVTAIVVPMDTPGGSAVPSIKLAEAIKAATAIKPVIAYVDEMAASGGMMISSACTEIYASSKHDIVGSIGTMMSWANFKKMYEMKGVEFHEVYATLSTNKNKIFREANKGNYQDLVAKMLDPLNEDFIAMVKANRGARLDNTNKKVYTGEIFCADYAMSFGLIEGIANFDSVITRARTLGKPKMKRYVV